LRSTQAWLIKKEGTGKSLDRRGQASKQSSARHHRLVPGSAAEGSIPRSGSSHRESLPKLQT
jgi:hypothetical protein